MFAGAGASKTMASLVLFGSCYPPADSSRHIKVEGTLARAALEMWSSLVALGDGCDASLSSESSCVAIHGLVVSFGQGDTFRRCSL
jgi:hypothetical protein